MSIYQVRQLKRIQNLFENKKIRKISIDRVVIDRNMQKTKGDR